MRRWPNGWAGGETTQFAWPGRVEAASQMSAWGEGSSPPHAHHRPVLGPALTPEEALARVAAQRDKRTR